MMTIYNMKDKCALIKSLKLYSVENAKAHKGKHVTNVCRLSITFSSSSKSCGRPSVITLLCAANCSNKYCPSPICFETQLGWDGETHISIMRRQLGSTFRHVSVSREFIGTVLLARICRVTICIDLRKVNTPMIYSFVLCGQTLKQNSGKQYRHGLFMLNQLLGDFIFR